MGVRRCEIYLRVFNSISYSERFYRDVVAVEIRKMFESDFQNLLVLLQVTN
jgi:hypothetical protein